MTYCHECGSEIAEIDAYCPFCGIALKPAAGSVDSALEQDKTIAVNQADLAGFLNENAVGKDDISSEPEPEKDQLPKEEGIFARPETPAVEPFAGVRESEPAAETEPAAGVDEQFVQPGVEAPGSGSFAAPEQTASEEPAFDDATLVDIPKPMVLEELGRPVENFEEPQTEPSVPEAVAETQDESLSPAVEEPEPAAVEEKEFSPVESAEENAAEQTVAAEIKEPVAAEEIQPFAVEESEPAAANAGAAEVIEPAAFDVNSAEENLAGVNAAEENLIEEKEPAAAEEAAPAEEKESVVEAADETGQTDFQSDSDQVETVTYFDSKEYFKDQPRGPQSLAEDLPAAAAESESVIEKPSIPVEEPENRDTTFDSVKIMHDRKEDVSKKPDASDVQREASSPVSSGPAEDVPPKAEKGRSYTTPNIGLGDTDGRKAPKLKPLDEGTVLNGRYEIVRKIGGGGMGAVYLATDRNLGGILRAVKEMIQSYIEESQQEKAISDFKRESMLLTSLDHPSIPTIYDYFYDEKEGRFYLVMKYISGGDLASRLRAAPEGRIDEETVVGWAIQIADVLDYLHNRQPPIVYRDLKPANIMIDGNSGRTMLIDFGIARWINKEEKGVTAVGTMGYAPPELFSGRVEPASDIYSLGSTMFHLLTGADPQSNPLLIFDFQKHPRPRQINPQLSDQIEKILLKMVEYNAEKRFRSAAEVREVLTKHYENLKAGRVTYGISKTPSAVPFSEQTVFCGFCGQKIIATDMFCAFCGSKQPIAQQGVHSAEYHLPQATAKLVVLGTNDLELPTFVIEKDDNLLGRRDPLSNIFPEIDLSKYDPQTKISRRHAHIWREGGQFKIEDLGSSNGTLVLRTVGDAFKLNPHQPYTLVSGEKIKVGDTTLHFVIG
jgi:tRNA A-37 threonylcarbamoyl transferase component Bud32